MREVQGTVPDIVFLRCVQRRNSAFQRWNLRFQLRGKGWFSPYPLPKFCSPFLFCPAKKRELRVNSRYCNQEVTCGWTGAVLSLPATTGVINSTINARVDSDCLAMCESPLTLLKGNNSTSPPYGVGFLQHTRSKVKDGKSKSENSVVVLTGGMVELTCSTARRYSLPTMTSRSLLSVCLTRSRTSTGDPYRSKRSAKWSYQHDRPAREVRNTSGWIRG